MPSWMIKCRADLARSAQPDKGSTNVAAASAAHARGLPNFPSLSTAPRKASRSTCISRIVLPHRERPSQDDLPVVPEGSLPCLEVGMHGKGGVLTPAETE